MGAMKWMALAGAVLLGGCASAGEDDKCYENLGACLLLGTAQTVAYVGVAALMERHHEDRHHENHHHGHGKKGKR